MTGSHNGLTVVYLVGHGEIDAQVPDNNLQRRTPPDVSVLFLSAMGCKLGKSFLTVDEQVRKVLGHVVHKKVNAEYKYSSLVDPDQPYVDTRVVLKDTRLDFVEKKMHRMNKIVAALEHRKFMRQQMMRADAGVLAPPKLTKLQSNISNISQQIVNHRRQVAEHAKKWLEAHPNWSPEFKGDGVHIFKCKVGANGLVKDIKKEERVDYTGPGVEADGFVRVSKVVAHYNDTLRGPLLFVVDTCRVVKGNRHPGVINRGIYDRNDKSKGDRNVLDTPVMRLKWANEITQKRLTALERSAHGSTERG